MRSEEDISKYLRAFGKRVKYLREQRGLTQVQLADKIEVDSRQLQRIEAGRTNTSIATAYTLCHVFGISMAELFSFDDTEEQKLLTD